MASRRRRARHVRVRGVRRRPRASAATRPWPQPPPPRWGRLALTPLRRRLQRRVDRRLYPLGRPRCRRSPRCSATSTPVARAPSSLPLACVSRCVTPGCVSAIASRASTAWWTTSAPRSSSRRPVDAMLDGTAIGALGPSVPGLRPELLREVAAASTTLVEVVRLRLELSAALQEVEASRARLVHAGDRGAPPARARPARRRAAAPGLARHGAAAGPAAARRRRHRVDRLLDQRGRRAGDGGGRAAPDRPRSAAEQPRRRAARRACRPDRSTVRSRSGSTCTPSRCPTTSRRPPTTSRARRSPTRSSTPRHAHRRAHRPSRRPARGADHRRRQGRCDASTAGLGSRRAERPRRGRRRRARVAQRRPGRHRSSRRRVPCGS